MLHFGVDPAALRAPSRLRRPPVERHRCSTINQLLQSRERVFAIPFLAAIAPRLDDKDAVGRDPLIARAQQPILYRLGQRRGADVVAYVKRVRHFVDILPARALRAGG